MTVETGDALVLQRRVRQEHADACVRSGFCPDLRARQLRSRGGERHADDPLHTLRGRVHVGEGFMSIQINPEEMGPDELFRVFPGDPVRFTLTSSAGMVMGSGALHEHAAAAVALNALMETLGAPPTPPAPIANVILLRLNVHDRAISVRWCPDIFKLEASLPLDDRARGFFEEFTRLACDDEKALAYALTLTGRK